MEALLIVLVLMWAWIRLSREYREGTGMSEWLTVAAYKAAGAIAGSGIAAWFRKSVRWLLQLVAGSWLGYTASPWLMDYAGWPATPDYLLFSGTLMGVTSYGLLELILSAEVAAIARSLIRRRAKALESDA